MCGARTAFVQQYQLSSRCIGRTSRVFYASCLVWPGVLQTNDGKHRGYGVSWHLWGPLPPKLYQCASIPLFWVLARTPPRMFTQVQAPFETRPGEIPRRIQIERKRRLYLQHRIETLLQDRGIDYAQPTKSALAFLGASIRPLPVEASAHHNRGKLRTEYE